MKRLRVNLPPILMLIGSVMLIAALALAAWRQANPAWKQYTGSAEVRIITPSLSGEPEMCLTCHEGIEQIDEAHPVEAFGCVRCHGGDRLALDQAQAHAGMYGGGNPSDLSVVSQGCGGSDCHGGAEADQRDHIQRVSRSVQATYAGAVNRLLRDFNVPVPDGTHYGISTAADIEISHPDAVGELMAFDAASFNNPAIETFGQACQTCHLTAAPIQEPFYFRGTGCAACHVIYGLDGLYTGGDPTIARDEVGHPIQHRMTTQIPYTTCNTCHNRGNYSLAQMSFLPRTDLDLSSLPSDEDALRLASYYQPIGQFTLCEWELDCIDCHTSREVMGDGDIHLSQASAQSVQCQTCHGTLTEMPVIATITDPDDPALRRANLNPHYAVSVGDQVVLAPDGTLMGWLQMQDGLLVQISQVTGTRYEVPPVMGSACQQQIDQQESRYCHECHAYNRN